MTDDIMKDYKEGAERRIAQIIGDMEATTGTNVEFVEIVTCWTKTKYGEVEIVSRTVNLKFIQL